MATTYLTRTISSATTPTKLTVSFWVKRSKLGATQRIITQNNNGGGNNFYWRFESNDQLTLWNQIDGSSTWADIKTNRLFRDTNSWYHICCMWDSTQNTEANRMKLYVNGVQETSLATNTYPSQNTTFGGFGNTTCKIDLGYYRVSNIEYFDGLLSHVHVTDGYAYDASAFGETDTTTGEWRAKTSPSVNYGTNGFLILKDGNTITDQSSNSNDFTLGGGTLTDLKDNPDNIFATWNSLAQTLSGISYSSGNTVATMTGDVGQRESISTLGMDSGKFYMECKLQAIGSTGGSYPYIGIVAQEKYDADLYIGGNGCGWHPTGDIYNGGSNSSTGSTYTTGDIIGVAVDVTNSKLYWHKNGTYITIGGNVQNPSTGSYGFDISARTAEGTLGFGVSSWNNNGIWQVNFGNGFFGTTAITTNSGNGYSGAEGSSKFNYTVPTGYSALSTKGLNE